MGTRVVKNYPSPRLMETIGATNQTPQEAIGELVANCFDARYNKEKLHISIDMRNDRIVVMDDGIGMTSEILEKAVCIAEDMSKYIERGEETKGHFGMGFKTSCSTLGDFYEIYTRPFGENLEYHTSFDIKDYSTRPSGSDAWDIIIEDGRPTASSPLKTSTHGTAFVISKLKIKDFPVSAVLEYIGNAFKGHIESGDEITIIDETGSHPATPKKYKFIIKVRIDETFGPKDKYHITGWVAIDSQTHNDGFYGFNIYRRGQLVVTHDKSWFRAHLMTSRIIGEVNMDFLDATFYKQGIQHTEDWEYVKTQMNEYLKGIVKASYDLSRKGNVNKASERKAILSQLEKEYAIEYEKGDITISPTDNPVVEEEPKPVVSINNTVKSIVTEKSLVLEDGNEIQITFIEKEEDGHDVGPYDFIFDDIMSEPQELQVIVYKNHPLWRKKIDSEVRKIIATSDAIYRALVDYFDVDSRKALKIRNEWVTQRTESMK